MQNFGSLSVWHEAQMPLPRSSTIGPCALVQPGGCGISRPLWHLVQKAFCWWHSRHWVAVSLRCIAILGLFAGTPLMWHVLQVSGSFTPSWQRAQIDILFCDVRETAS